jgi:hypothetical protein
MVSGIWKRISELEHQKVSTLFFNNINELPLWVKQVVHLRADTELKTALEEYLQTLNPQGILQQIIPPITQSGKEELKNKGSNLTQEQVLFLFSVAHGYDLFEIALTNFWSLEQVCKYYSRLVDLKLVQAPACRINSAVMQFLAGKIKTGDVLVKLGKVNMAQVDKALRTQKEREKEGREIKTADLLVEFGHVSKKDIDILMGFKEESKKRFVMGLGLSTLKINNDGDGQRIVNNMQRELKRLTHENAILKERLQKILNIKV